MHCYADAHLQAIGFGQEFDELSKGLDNMIAC